MKCFYEVEGVEATLVGTFDMGLEAHRLTLRRRNGGEETFAVPEHFGFRVDELMAKGGYTPQLAHFDACFRKGTTPDENGQDGWNVLRIIAASYLAAAAKKPFDLAGEIPEDRTPIELLAC